MNSYSMQVSYKNKELLNLSLKFLPIFYKKSYFYWENIQKIDICVNRVYNFRKKSRTLHSTKQFTNLIHFIAY